MGKGYLPSRRRRTRAGAMSNDENEEELKRVQAEQGEPVEDDYDDVRRDERGARVSGFNAPGRGRDEMPLASPSEINAANRKFYEGTKSQTVSAGGSAESTPAPGTGRESEERRFMPNATGAINEANKTSRTSSIEKMFGNVWSGMSKPTMDFKRTSNALQRMNAANRRFYRGK
jgi:hypothetical protein